MKRGSSRLLLSKFRNFQSAEDARVQSTAGFTFISWNNVFSALTLDRSLFPSQVQSRVYLARGLRNLPFDRDPLINFSWRINRDGLFFLGLPLLPPIEPAPSIRARVAMPSICRRRFTISAYLIPRDKCCYRGSPSVRRVVRGGDHKSSGQTMTWTMGWMSRSDARRLAAISKRPSRHRRVRHGTTLYRQFQSGVSDKLQYEKRFPFLTRCAFSTLAIVADRNGRNDGVLGTTAFRTGAEVPRNACESCKNGEKDKLI